MATPGHATKATGQEPSASSSAPGNPATATRPDADGSKARRVTFRVLAILTTIWVLLVTIFALTEIVLMFVPGETLRSAGIPFSPEEEVHRTHLLSVGIIAWALLLGVAPQLWRPARREAPMLHVLVIAVGAIILNALSGSLVDWLVEDLTLAVPVLLLGLLHPRARQLFRMPRWDRPMAVLAGVAAVPWLVFAFTQARHQWRPAAGDAHAEAEHWVTAVLLALVMVACALIGSTSRSGWRLTAWIAAVAPAGYGAHSLVFPDRPSAAAAPWAAAAIAWGAVYAVAIVRRSRDRGRVANAQAGEPAGAPA